ncbi:MAG: universal stress protein [Desulfobacterales bacterium]|nr:universal stress protein [Desulfobacterales bacterium]MBS3755048.1 universal stress protein [Desulfobacterales bacterium]
MFRNILIPLDGSRLAEGAVSCTLAFARAFGSKVTLLRVLEKPQHIDSPYPIDPLDWNMSKREVRAYLEELGSRFEAEGIAAEFILKEGEPARRIIEVIRQAGIDLMVVSTHGKSGLSGWYAGSVLQKIVMRARISIMLVRAFLHGDGDPSVRFLFNSILVPLDGSKRSEFALTPATSLARAHDAQLILAHVVPRPEMPRWTQQTREDVELADRIVERNLEEMGKHFESLVFRLPVEARTLLETADDVAVRLHELVSRKKADLVVMSAHGYSGQSRWTYGSIAQTFIAYGTTPLLLVQDFPKDAIELTEAEAAAAEKKGH